MFHYLALGRTLGGSSGMAEITRDEGPWTTRGRCLNLGSASRESEPGGHLKGERPRG
jgi:hypothetical protein